MRQLSRKVLKAYIDYNTSNPAFITTLTAERDTLALELVSNPEAMTDIVSGSGNGTSFTGQVTMNKVERLEFLQYIVDVIASGQLPPNTTYARFC